MKSAWITAQVATTVVASMIVGAAPTMASARAPDAAFVQRPISTASGGQPAQRPCQPVRPAIDFYEAGRVASFPVTVPRSACRTISVSHIEDPRNPSDHCQSFLLGFFPTDGSEPTYTEPVPACSVPASVRTVLASDVPDGTVYRVLYAVDYIEPRVQVIRYQVWH